MRRFLKPALVVVLIVLTAGIFLKGTIPQPAIGNWLAAGSMTAARSGAASALLQDGRILITGGDNGAGPVASAEVFDTTGAFVAIAPMGTARSAHSATVLVDGRVLVAGGSTGAAATNAAEIFDPAANAWTPVAGGMIQARSNHTASLLADGRVLFAGGDNAGVPTAALEIFDPVANTFSSVGAMTSARTSFASAILSGGQVMLIGGSNGTAPLASTEIFDPTTNLVKAGPVLSAPRLAHSATTLIDGRVLVVGGTIVITNPDGSTTSADSASAEIYDPPTGNFAVSASSLAAPRRDHAAFLLPNNASVLIVGGTSAGNEVVTAEIFVPSKGTFAATGSPSAARQHPTGSALSQDGILFLAGGSNSTGTLSSAELYGFATVKTDAKDYAPGNIVTITGSGWQPGETVTLTLVESPLFDTHPVLTAVADSTGSILNNQFSPDQHDIGIRFYLTASGSVSQAQTAFMDGNVKVMPQPGNVTFSLTSTLFTATTNCTGAAQNPVVTTVSSGGSTFGVTSVQSIRLVAAATGTNNQNQTATFGYWSSPDPFTFDPLTPSIICVAGFGNGTQNYSANYNGLIKLAFTTPAFSVNTGSCSPVTTIQTQNAANVGTNTPANLPVNLASSSVGGLFYNSADTTCSLASITGLTIPINGNTASFRYKDSNGGSPIVTASAPGTTIASTTQTETVSAAPTVTTVSPTSGSATGGTSVAITGTNFTGATAVKFGSANATSFTVNSATQITATAPPGSAGTVDITVTTAGGTSATSASDQYTYVAAPTVTSVSPTSGPTAGGNTVTINGTNLASATAVKFGANSAAILTNSATQITATAPAGSAGTVNITVTTAGGTSATSASDQYTYVAAPTVTSLSPTSGPTAGGNTVTISGTNLASATAVKFGANSAAILTNSATQITATAPPGSAGTVDITVTTAGGTSATSASDQYTYVAAPTVTSLSPTSGPTAGGNTVTISGTNLASATAVKFGANSAAILTNSATQITATAPPGSAGTVNITVTTAGGTSATSASDQYTYVAAPTVTSLSPTSGPTAGGNTVTINGTNLASATAVKFGANSAAILTNSATQITATAPAGSAGTVDITVTTAGGTSATSASDQYTYVAAPTVTSLSPTSGPTAGGNTVTINGTNLASATAVKFGANSAAILTNSATQITATAPAGSAGTVNITVTTAGGTSATSASDQYTYVAAPTVTSLSPTSGPTAGGNTVTINGTNLASATAVKFGANSAAILTNSATQITATAPAGSAGTVDIAVTTAGGTSATNAADQYTYQAPTSTTISAPTVTYPAGGVVTVTVSSTAGTPTGNATLTVDGGAPLTQALSGGVATFTLTSPSTGVHNLSASYAAQGDFAASGPTTGTLTVVLPPTITSDATTTFIAGTAGTFNVTTMGFPTASLMETGALPVGVWFADNLNGTATLAGAATVAGSYPITIAASNGVGSQAMQTFTLVVTAGDFTKLQLLVPGETAAPGTASGKTGTPNTEYVNGAFNVIVNAVDANWNVVSSVTDTVNIASTDTDPNVKLPANAALVAGTGTFSVTLQTVSYNPATTTLTDSDVTDSSKTASTSPAIEVIIVYTAGMAPTMVATGDSVAYTLTVNNAAAPNTNTLRSVTVAIPAEGGTPSLVSVTAANAGPIPANWTADLSQISSHLLRFTQNAATDGVGPGGTISIQFTSTATNTVSGTVAQNVWTTTAFSDAAYASALPLAGTEPTVSIGARAVITSADHTTNEFTYGATGTFTITTTGFPTPSLSQSAALPGGVTFKDNGDDTATLTGTPTAAGNFILTITAHNGYGSDATQTFTLTVNKATATPSITADDKYYDGTTTATIHCMLSGVLSADTANVTCSGTGSFADANAGPGKTVTSNNIVLGGSASGNYMLSTTTATTSAKINAKPVTATITASNKNYDGNNTATITSCTIPGKVGSDDVACSVPAGNATFASANASPTAQTVTATGITLSGNTSSNYTLSTNTSATTTATINTALLTITANDKSKTYGGTDPIFDVSYSGFVNSEGASVLAGTAVFNFAGKPPTSYGPSTTVPTNAGIYAVRPSGLTSSNYAITFKGGTYTINTADAHISVTPYSVNYDGHPHTASVTSITGVNGETGATVGTVDVSHTTNTVVGTYGSDYWTFTGTANYNNIGNTTITDIINKATAIVTIAPYSVPYDGNSHTATVTSITGVNGETGATVGTVDVSQTMHINASTYNGDPWSFTGTSNYNSSNGAVTDVIKQAPLTITASSGSMIYGGPVFPVSASYMGFVPGEGHSNLTPEPTCGTSATSSSPVGTYPSACIGAVDSNYSFNYVSGFVTVSQATTATAVVTSVTPSTFMQLVTFTATVTPLYAGTVPTGTVTFYNNGSSIGTSLVSVTSCGTPPCPDQAAFSTPSLPDSGPDNITAIYNGDGNFMASTSPAITQTVQPAPNVSLSPMSVSFGNQNVNTTSKPAVVTLANIGDATLNISSTNGISITPTTDFTQTNTCGTTVLQGKSCTISITFTPVDTGIRTATLQITDNDDDATNAQQTVALTGAGLSTIIGSSLYTDAIFATANGCGSIVMSGGSTVDSFNSTQGFAISHLLSGGNVGTNGNVTLNGGKSAIYGSAAVPTATTGNCSKTSLTGVTTSGGAQVTGGLVPLNTSLNYPVPPAPTLAPPTTTQNISGSCGFISTCTNTGTKTVSLAPGQYGNLNISGGTTAHFSKGTYNINSLSLTGQSIFYVDSGPVIVNLAGASLNGGNAAMDASGGTIQNPSGNPANLQFTYAGSRGLNLSGGSASYATVDAPNALVNMSGGSDFFGSIIASTVTNSGGTAMHGDTSLPAIQMNNYIWFNAVVNNVNGLPANGAQVKLYLTNSSISFPSSSNQCPGMFSSISGQCTLAVPNAVVTFNSASQGMNGTSPAKTSYDLTNNRWSTAVSKTGLTGNTFVTGVAIPVPVTFPTGIQNVAWSTSFSTDTPGITLQWQWAAAVYNSFNTTYATATNSNALGVNAEDGSADANGTDPAGTPETFKGLLLFGATGGGGTNYTGYFTPGAGVVPTVAPMSVSPSSLDFGLQNQGTASGSMTTVLTNNDSVSHSFSAIAPGQAIQIMGTNASNFALVPNGSATPNNCVAMTGLAYGASCTLYVMFTPSDVGTRTAKIVLNDDANNSPQTVYLSGTGQ